MYCSVDEIKVYLVQKDIYCLFIFCEYVYVMGNSVGGLKEYWDVFENNLMVQGGCVWDWVDQLFCEIDLNGCWYWLYGGDYGLKGILSFGNFCCNGLVSVDCVFYLYLFEVKKIYQNIKCILINKNNLIVRVKNWFDFFNFNEYIFYWQVVGDNGKLLVEGNKEVNCVLYVIVDVILGKVVLFVNVCEGYFNLSWICKEVLLMVGIDWEVVYD